MKLNPHGPLPHPQSSATDHRNHSNNTGWVIGPCPLTLHSIHRKVLAYDPPCIYNTHENSKMKLPRNSTRMHQVLNKHLYFANCISSGLFLKKQIQISQRENLRFHSVTHQHQSRDILKWHPKIDCR